MSESRKVSRRDFIKLAGSATAGAAVAATLSKSIPALAAASQPAPAFGVGRLLQTPTVKIGVLSSNEQILKDLIAKADFAKNVGVNVETVVRSDTKETELARLTSAIQAGTSPYDIIDFEDELTTTLSRAGFVIGLDDILPKDLWSDFSDAMVAYTKTWSTYNGETFRVIHNWEMPYWWYRKDWFTAKGVAVPKTWDDVKAMGKVFTDSGTGVWATEDGLMKGAFLNVYLAWVTLQAGGNPFDVGDAYKTSLQYIYDLMYTHNAFNPASLQKSYDQLNADYLADKVAFMRQWPYFGDIARSKDNAKWFSDDKIAVALPPVGPGGKGGSTYTAAWGFGIVKTSPNLDAAKQVMKYLVSNDVAVQGMKSGFWFLNARKSVLAAADPNHWLVQQMKMYTDAGVIGVRPFHPQFVEALTILEDTASAYLTKQINLDDALKQAKDQLAALGPSTPAATASS
jgi:ABC-type glycerol-3-phosphate transport system substrate-binding protein